MTLQEVEKMLVDTINKIAQGRNQLRAGKVTAVDEDKLICTVEDELRELIYYKVRLKAVVDGTDSGIYAIPAIGSQVICGQINNALEAQFVVLLGDIDKYIIIIGNSRLEICDGKFEFNEGNNGGLINVGDLVTELNKTNTYLSTLKSALGTITVALDVLLPGTSLAFEGTMSAVVLGDYSEIEDDKILH